MRHPVATPALPRDQGRRGRWLAGLPLLPGLVPCLMIATASFAQSAFAQSAFAQGAFAQSAPDQPGAAAPTAVHALPAPPQPPKPAAYIETPSLAAAIADGKLPPVAERVPTMPAVVAGTGTPGGELRMLMSSAKDTRLMVVYGYARLVAYDPKFEVVPDLVESVDIDQDRSFTFHLRPGHKWSDGSPFTSEDFRYYWEDVANNSQLSPSGPPMDLLIDKEAPKVEFPDALTVRYSWSKPNPHFLADLAGSLPLDIYRPSAYLKNYHIKYADKDKLDALVKQVGVRNWAELHNRLDHMYHNDNPRLPSLQPWVLATKPPSERFVFRRNPYYYRVDEAGHQLPYIDQVTMSIADSKIIPAKTGAGESDLQARFLRFDNYTFLKAAEHRNDFRVNLWQTAKGSHLALYPNLNNNDPGWRTLLRDVRFRRALSLGIDRHEINQVIFYGLGLEGQNTALPQSALYKEAYRTDYTKFDIKEANRLLDDIGLTKRDDHGIRLMPDGRPVEIVVENTGENTGQADALELIHDSWADIGVAVFGKAEQVDVMRRRIFGGDSVMVMDEGFDDGLPTANASPAELAPVQQQAWEWPAWGAYAETAGRSGTPPDMPGPQRLLQLYNDWSASTDRNDRARIWDAMLGIQADQLYTIGIVAAVPQPVVVSNRLHNLPDKGIFSWQPGAQFGMYKPDHFWMSPTDPTVSGAQTAAGTRQPLSSIP